MAAQPTPPDEAKTQPKPSPQAGAEGNGYGNGAPPKSAPSKGAPAKNPQATQPQAKPAARKPIPRTKDNRPSGGAAGAPKPLPKGQEPKGHLREELEELSQQGGLMLALREWARQAPSWLTSMVVHVVVLLILGLLWLPLQTNDAPQIDAKNLNEIEEIEEIQEEILEEIPEINPSEMVEAVETSSEVETFEPVESIDTSAAAMDVDLAEINSDQKLLDGNLLKKIGQATGGDLSGRGDPNAKKRLLTAGGGNEASERAVGLALQWLANHQLPDGSWCFDHRFGPCQGRCGDPGSIGKENRNGATGMALLPFLGAGNTHKKGKYSKNVYMGIRYLTSQMKPDGSLHEGGSNMYGHGICAIALAEDYAMTQDKTLRGPAQAAINFIVAAQDPVGGGWRYQPRQAGDTSVVGWQLMALKSGHMGYLAVPPRTVAGCNNFLNSVQSESGAKYGYTNPGRGPATTAIGLLCRMYMGWRKDNGALHRGVEYLSAMGPSTGNMYYNYYATQVLHHFEGPEWEKWNEVMRDFLIDTQEQDGHEKGSWHFKQGHHDRGGRLYNTCMACMTLEVYYRHLPIYRKQAAEDDFDE